MLRFSRWWSKSVEPNIIKRSALVTFAKNRRRKKKTHHEKDPRKNAWRYIQPNWIQIMLMQNMVSIAEGICIDSNVDSLQMISSLLFTLAANRKLKPIELLTLNGQLPWIRFRKNGLKCAHNNGKCDFWVLSCLSLSNYFTSQNFSIHTVKRRIFLVYPQQ